MKCKIISVGKRRDGGTRYWCLNHKADATAKYGVQAKYCRYSHIKPPKNDEIFELRFSDFDGGVALWGAVPPVYDTTDFPLERGVHVHGRQAGAENKVVDGTYREVSLLDTKNDLFQSVVQVSELEAIYFMVSSVFEFPTKRIVCTYCGYPHLDKDWFSVHTHQRHLCSGCGKKFSDSERAVGNPLANLQKQLVGKLHTTRKSAKTLDIVQADFPGGIQIWGSNPAILWSSTRSEEAGIHVHTYGKQDIDDTFTSVSVDGVSLDVTMVRVLMAQSALPHIAGRVVSLDCPGCGNPHFDIGLHAFTPHDIHECGVCKKCFKASGRKKKVISNPLLAIFQKLAVGAPRLPRVHDMGLIVESI